MENEKVDQDPPSGRVENDRSDSGINSHAPEKEHTQEQPNASQEKPDNAAQAASQDGGAEKPEEEKPKEDAPKGGYDTTPIPKVQSGYNVKITLHSAHNLPMADMNALSSDPYIVAQIDTDVPRRHKEDPPIRLRTPTIRKSIEPVWNCDWIVANVPASGFRLKLRLYDEDPNDYDDRLGNVHVHVGTINENWEGISKQSFSIKKRMGSKRAYLLQAIVTCFNREKHYGGEVIVSVKVLGKTGDDGQNGRLYTAGPSWWIRHFSPMLGRITGLKEPDDNDNDQGAASDGQSQQSRKIEKYNFQSNEMQLSGPVPAQLYHRFVEFKPWVQRMFTGSGIQGIILSKALHSQHSRVYHFDRTTVWGHFDESPSFDVTKKFLELVHYDQGGRIFTYVLTLDALLRFTETGKEFGIDMLSKHTMHSDVSVYIAFSGEFFVRRLKHANKPPPPEPVEETSQSHPPEHGENETHPSKDLPGGPPNEDPPKDPKHYELIIDNDSGTYRPNAKLLPQLKQFLAHALPGLHIQVLDCNEDKEKMDKWKSEQRERKKKEGDHVIYRQGSIGSSISSSDLDEFDERENFIRDSQASPQEQGIMKQAAKDQKRRQQARLAKAKRNYGGQSRDPKSADDKNAGGEAPAGPGESAAAESSAQQ